MNLIELFIDETTGKAIDTISIVETPAIEVPFVALKDENFVQLAEIDKEKRLLLGAALIPNKPILRRQGEQEYYIFFSADTVRKASELYLKQSKQHNSNYEHSGVPLDGLTVVESWIVEDEVHDKTRKYGMDVPVGTWAIAMKVDNEEVWKDYVKTGKVKGFSIEGYFSNEKPKGDLSDDELVEELKKLFEP